MKSAITVSLVPEARLGPFVFHGDLEDACRRASALGYDAIEVFPPSGEVVKGLPLVALLAKYELQLAAVGTGAGWVKHQLSLTSPDPEVRTTAISFIKQIIEAAGAFGAPAIIGSMQGKFDDAVGRDQALKWLAAALEELSKFSSSQFSTSLLIEPLNRYESNVLNRVDETARWLESNGLNNVKVLADFFHMNIEEANISAAVRAAGHWIGHVHFADSNRQAVGFGHSPISEAVEALQEIGYSGYLSAEILPRPDAQTAAQQTIESFRSLTGRGILNA